MRGRPRFQKGRLTKQAGNWRGDYYQHLTQPDGKIKRAHKSVVLGLRSEIRETEARRKLQEVIAKETHTRPDGRVSLEWFINNRWLVAKKARWKPSTLGTNTGIIQHQIVGALGKIPLEEFDKFKLQTHLNSLVDKGLSYSVIQHVHSFIRDIFAEAQDLEYIQKSPAIRLLIPRVVRPLTQDPRNGLDTGKPYLTLEDLTLLLQSLPNVKRPDRLIAMLASLCAMRPGEIFGLQWDCYTEAGLNIMQRVYRGLIDTPKSEASCTTLPVPTIVRAALDKWKSECYDSSPEAFMFATRGGRPVNVYNFLRRALKPAGKFLQRPVNFQALRRTWATHAGSFGADLKVLEAVLRHSASLNFTVGTYQQAIQEKVLEVMNKFAEAVAGTLSDVAPPTPAERRRQRRIERIINRMMEAAPPEKLLDYE
jgi:integrase